MAAINASSSMPPKRRHGVDAHVLNDSKIEKINMYKDNFKSLVSKSVETNTFIGDGNPDSQILLIGKEGSNVSLPPTPSCTCHFAA